MRYMRLWLLIGTLGLLVSTAGADSLTITYVHPDQTAAIGATGFITVTFFGSITNNTNSPLAFELLGGPQPPSPYVAGFISGVPFPGMTLAPGASTGIFALAAVNLNPFDPSLPYPGFVNIVLPAVDSVGNTLGESNAAIEVLHSVPEPSVLSLVLFAAAGAWLIRRSRQSIRALRTQAFTQ